jgi:hypothetical protein
MKYIRTEDGIYEYVDYDNECIIPSPIVKYKNKLTHCSECDIINHADTIEELCDEFVLEHPLFSQNCKTLYHSFEKAKHGIEKRLDGIHEEDKFVLYGAIWTDKGLIYVAKMNDKGELELL